jgi:hypothetical protein
LGEYVGNGEGEYIENHFEEEQGEVREVEEC